MGRPPKTKVVEKIDSSSEDEIPPKKTNGAAQDEDDDDDEGEEEEYAVEAVESHTFEDGILFYHVKWVGWDDRTWEPEENLDGCPDELASYHAQIGGKPRANAASKKKAAPHPASAGTKKRKLDNGNSATPEVPARSEKKSKKAAADAAYSITDDKTNETFPAPSGTWEDDVISVKNVSQSQDELLITIEWNQRFGSRTSSHKNRVIRQKCPQKLLDFYESHLHFGGTTTTTFLDKTDTFVDAPSEQADDDDDDDDGVDADMADGDEGGFVKGVATL